MIKRAAKCTKEGQEKRTNARKKNKMDTEKVQGKDTDI